MRRNKSKANNSENKNLKKLLPLFGDYELGSLKKNLTFSLVIARTLEMATPEQFRIFTSFIGNEAILKFLEEKVQKMLSKKDLNYRRLYYAKKAKESS
ncbi:hypothetical protein [Thermodesulfovibrio yellowstonii]|uniref:hypothetical protein n=1 Tax=Thermodesulfovibrio yellowstonii TaxID=28262 RepID=UPI003C7B2B9F